MIKILMQRNFKHSKFEYYTNTIFSFSKKAVCKKVLQAVFLIFEINNLRKQQIKDTIDDRKHEKKPLDGNPEAYFQIITVVTVTPITCNF